MALTMTMSACGGGATGGAAQSAAGGRQTTITAMGVSLPIVDNFNPFVPTSVASANSLTNFFYEPLIQFDLLKPGTTYPWLATSWKWSNGDRTLTLDLRKGVTWTDGKPFTARDVTFTFDLLKRYPAVNGNGIRFKTVRSLGPHAVQLTFAHPSYTEFYNIGTNVPIIPEHIWAHVNPTKFADKHPVGTGPFELKSITNESVFLSRNPHFWQKGKPAISGIRLPGYTGNTTADTAIEDGQLEWSGYFIPDQQKDYLSKSRFYHSFQPPTSVVALVPNLTVAPLNNLAVRRAISLGLNRPVVARLAESGQAIPVSTETGLLPSEQTYMSPSYKNAKFHFNDSKAKQLLKSAGFVMGKRGIFTKNGKPLSLSIVDPSGYTDYITGASVIQSELKKIGIAIHIQGVSTNAWTEDLASGKFDLTIDYSNGEGLTPFQVYQGWLDASLTAPVGKTALADWERWNDPHTRVLVRQYENATTSTARRNALYGMEAVLVKDLPVLPIFYGPDWAHYSTKHFTGFPSAANPYEPASPFAPTDEVVALRIKPKG